MDNIKKINDKAFKKWYRKLSKRDRKKHAHLLEESYNPAKPMTYGDYKARLKSK